MRSLPNPVLGAGLKVRVLVAAVRRNNDFQMMLRTEFAVANTSASKRVHIGGAGIDAWCNFPSTQITEGHPSTEEEAAILGREPIWRDPAPLTTVRFGPTLEPLNTPLSDCKAPVVTLELESADVPRSAIRGPVLRDPGGSTYLVLPIDLAARVRSAPDLPVSVPALTTLCRKLATALPRIIPGGFFRRSHRYPCFFAGRNASIDVVVDAGPRVPMSFYQRGGRWGGKKVRGLLGPAIDGIMGRGLYVWLPEYTFGVNAPKRAIRLKIARLLLGS